MHSDRPLYLVFFRTEAGTEPVREWLLSLRKPERKIVGSDILAVQYAWPVGKPLVDSFGNGLWEIRSKLKDSIARTLFIIANEEIVLMHAFIKKSRTTPKSDLQLARKRQKEYLSYL